MKLEPARLELREILLGHIHKVVDLDLVVFNAIDLVCLTQNLIIELFLCILKQRSHLPLEVMEIKHHLTELGIGFLCPLDIALPLLFIDMDKLFVFLICPLQVFKHPNHFLSVVLNLDFHFLEALVVVVEFGAEGVLFFVGLLLGDGFEKLKVLCRDQIVLQGDFFGTSGNVFLELCWLLLLVRYGSQDLRD